MTYFEFYDIPVSFKVDATALKRTFYALSKKYHPDFFTLETAEKQAEILELSTLNSQAYKTLSDFDLRMKYARRIRVKVPKICRGWCGSYRKRREACAAEFRAINPPGSKPIANYSSCYE